jgi:C1A family cysteine protease
MPLAEIKTIREDISKKGYQWSAGKTAISELPDDKRKAYLGLAIDEKQIEMMSTALAEEDAMMASDGIRFAYPATINWRNVGGVDWTTPIKDQKGCGSCVAFATTAVVESNLEIFRRNPYLNPNLAEADIFFCGCGKCCANGWNFPPALNYAKNSGIPDEACYPYLDKDQDCKPCPDRNKRIIKIEGWRSLPTASQAKEWLYRHGPVITGMAVYGDFFSYRGGVYRHTSGDLRGYHAIAVVGYNEVEQCWICKNSWGTGWGEGGWFRIRYGECGIGSSFPFYTVEFPALNDDIIMPKTAKVYATFKSKSAAFENEFRLQSPASKLIFKATDSVVGKTFDVGTFNAGQKLIFALKTPDGNIYYTTHAWNKDACDHVIKVQTGAAKWELRWEDLYGLGDRDYNDDVVVIEIK